MIYLDNHLHGSLNLNNLDSMYLELASHQNFVKKRKKEAQHSWKKEDF